MKPDGQRRHDAQLGVERYGYRSVRADVSDTWGADGAVDLRIGAILEGGPGRRRFDDIESYGVAPALAWQIHPGTRITLEADLLKASDRVAPDRPPLGPVLAFSERGTLGEAGDRIDDRSQTWRLAVEHVLSPRQRLRQAVFVQRSNSGTDATDLDVYGVTGPDVLLDGGRGVRRVAIRRRERTASEVSQTEWYARMATPLARHELLVGVELGRYRTSAQGSIAPLAPLDLQAPQYGAMPGEYEQDVSRYDGNRTQVLYLQDRLTLGPRWRALVALRAEHVSAWSHNELDGEHYSGRHSMLSPRFGVVFEPRPHWAWFASWTQSSRPQLGQATATGDLLAPEESRQFEFGVQWGRADDGLMTTVSVFQLEKRHLATLDPSHPSFALSAGERRSRGIEVDIRGRPWTGAQLDASVEWLHAEVVKDPVVRTGTPLPGVARWFATTWLTQTVNDRWTLGWGLIGEGRRRAALPPDDLRLPSYVMVDLSTAYRVNGWRVQATLGNVFGRRALISDGYYVKVAEPRALGLTASLSF